MPAGLQLSRALLRNQGLAGTAGFLSGFRGATSRGKRHLAALLDDACAGDEVAVQATTRPTPRTLTRGDDERIGTSDLVALLHGGRWDGMIRAGQRRRRAGPTATGVASVRLRRHRDPADARSARCGCSPTTEFGT